ncbi:hypothetical protein BV25DRAFT_1843584 [Artomyces pyxidatus]|uniref:Uncharacterized protein n=1 Tax=Artomyces pyxidatus TaxID=48021 RepID=A0ACB8SE81_9AGAM|nr:hypothetical protein BV25DRAFT_1843584 [Artomyces pyxidatus]
MAEFPHSTWVDAYHGCGAAVSPRPAGNQVNALDSKQDIMPLTEVLESRFSALTFIIELTRAAWAFHREAHLDQDYVGIRLIKQKGSILHESQYLKVVGQIYRKKRECAKGSSDALERGRVTRATRRAKRNYERCRGLGAKAKSRERDRSGKSFVRLDAD